jgi:hypothetical protein
MRSKRCLFCLLDFMLPVGNLMFPIANLIVDGGCIATTDGSSLFCIQILYIYTCTTHTQETTHMLTSPH